ncbi:hypothetical protein [Aestuariivivens insulae]|uniref:hypothetical protein n=1 Tax=Aestuariivivens insulae TaxID=1621988 RepID=UPI001F56C31E|nr:hypothetical protein [Aestuariivivens insulae]
MRKVFVSLCSILIGSSVFAQNIKNDSSWVFEAGINAVDVYPVGKDSPQGAYFEEFFNATDHWNFGIPTVKVARYINEAVFLSVRATFNKISKWGELPGQSRAEVDRLNYLGLDAMLNKNLKNIFHSEKFEPFIGIGLGYTWIEEGPYNSNANGIDDLVGAGTLNGVLGVKYWISKNIGVNIETAYKHTFESYLTRHWQHSLGVIFKLEKCVCY